MDIITKSAIVALSFTTFTFFFSPMAASLILKQEVPNWESVLTEAKSKAKAKNYEGAIAGYSRIINSINTKETSREEEKLVLAAYRGRFEAYKALSMFAEAEADLFYVHSQLWF